MANTILLKGRGIRREAVGAETITPGHLLTINTSGQLIKHATARGRAPAIFAVENDLLGKTISDNYVANDYVQAEHLYPGCEVLALVAANAPAIVIGDVLESAGDGTLRKRLVPLATSVGTGDGTIADVTSSFSQSVLNNNFKDVADAVNATQGSVIAMALEALDNSAVGSVARIKVVLI